MARQRQLPLNVRFAEEVNTISFRGNIEKVVSMRLLQQQKHDHVQSLSGENSEDSMKWNGSLTLDEVFKPGSTTSIGSSGGSNNNNNNRRQWNNKFAGKIGSSTSNGGSSTNSNNKEQWTKKIGKTGSGSSGGGSSNSGNNSSNNISSSNNRGQWTKKFKLLNFSKKKKKNCL